LGGALVLLFLMVGGRVGAFPAPVISPKGDSEKPKLEVPAAMMKPAPESLDDLKAIQAHVKKVLERVMPSTVGLRVGGASGSGVIISSDGYVLTAGHVSGEPGRTATIILPDGRMLKGKTLGVNKRIDSGLIKITDKGRWPAVEMGESAKLAKGQWCLATGHPGGYKKGRSPVVRLGRVVLAEKTRVQTDCALVGGDSGGPLFDMTGKVIGIHSRIGLRIEDNVHVPVDTYRSTWDRLVASESWGGGLFGSGKADAAYLGVRCDLEASNCKIREVIEGQPADKAGLKAGDVIVNFAGKKIDEYEDLIGALSKKKADDEVMVKVKRGADIKTFKVKLGRVPSS
jgi:serine protease Do